MHLASLAVIGLIMASTPAYAGAPSGEQSAKAACVTSLERAKGSSGFEVVRKCAPANLAASSAVAQPMGQARGRTDCDDNDDDDDCVGALPGVGRGAGAGVDSGAVAVVGLIGLASFAFGVVNATDKPSSP